MDAVQEVIATGQQGQEAAMHSLVPVLPATAPHNAPQVYAQATYAKQNTSQQQTSAAITLGLIHPVLLQTTSVQPGPIIQPNHVIKIDQGRF